MVFVKYRSRNGHGQCESTVPAIIVVFLKVQLSEFSWREQETPHKGPLVQSVFVRGEKFSVSRIRSRVAYY